MFELVKRPVVGESSAKNDYFLNFVGIHNSKLCKFPRCKYHIYKLFFLHEKIIFFIDYYTYIYIFERNTFFK